MMLVFVELPDMEEKLMSKENLSIKDIESKNAELSKEINKLKADISQSLERIEQLEHIIAHPENVEGVEELTQARNEKQILEDKLSIYKAKLTKVQTPESNSPIYCSIQAARATMQKEYEQEIFKLAEKARALTEKYSAQDASICQIYETRRMLQPNTKEIVNISPIYTQTIYNNTSIYLSRLDMAKKL